MTTPLPSKERLAEIHKLAAKSDKYIYHLRADEVEAMARALLAAHEQEPVAWLLSGGGAKNDVRFDSGNAYADPLREVTPLYAAPQVTSVPEKVPESLKDRMLTICDLVEDNDEYCQDIWNACRAAMLNGGKS